MYLDLQKQWVSYSAMTTKHTNIWSLLNNKLGPKMSNKFMIILEPNYYIKCNQINFNALKNLIRASKDVLLFLCTYVPLWTIKIWRNKLFFFRSWFFIVHKKKKRERFVFHNGIHTVMQSQVVLYLDLVFEHISLWIVANSTRLNNLTIKSKRMYSFELKVDLKHHLLHRSWAIRI